MLRPLVQPRIRTTHVLAQQVTPGQYLLATGPAEAVEPPEPPPPVTDQTVLTVGLNETQYGYNGDEATGAVVPADVFGTGILYLYGDTFNDTMVLKFVGNVQISGVSLITMALSGGGIPPGPFALNWNGTFSRYEVVHAVAVLYLQGQNGNNVTVDVEYQP